MLSLYLVTAEAEEDAQLYGRVRAAVQGGVTCVQLREKNPEVCLRRARLLRALLAPLSVPLIINDQAEVALACQAGLHIGQQDMPYEEARALLGPDALIGLTVNTWADVERAEAWDIDYLGVQVFSSARTKPEETQFWGLEGLREVRARSRHRLVAIGGICLENIHQVYGALNPESDGVALVGALWRAPDPCAAAQALRGWDV
jgi:thiamine-phosphate pyrophosphorylase